LNIDILKGENGSAIRRKSRSIPAFEAQQQTFHKLRNVLASEDVIFRYPDYKNWCLKNRELNYASNERGLLAIICTLEKLRHYLYADKGISIYSDHKPITFAVSESRRKSRLLRVHLKGHGLNSRCEKFWEN